MESVLVTGVWLGLVAASCGIGMLIGERIGAGRMRRLHGIAIDILQANAPDTADQALVVEPWKLEGRIAPRASGKQVSPAQAEQTIRRRHSFAMMPSLDDLRTEADAIRCSEKKLSQSVWDDPALGTKRLDAEPIAARVLSHYEESVRRLSELSSAKDKAEASDSESDGDKVLLRISEIAPLAPSTKADDLARLRAAHNERATRSRAHETNALEAKPLAQPSASSSLTRV